MGTWQIPLETPTGRLVANIVFRLEAGKVVAGLSAPNFKEFKVTDITKAGQVVTLKASTDYSGPLASYAGPVNMVLTLRPKGPDLAAAFSFNELTDRRHGQEEGLSRPDPTRVLGALATATIMLDGSL